MLNPWWPFILRRIKTQIWGNCVDLWSQGWIRHCVGSQLTVRAGLSASFKLPAPLSISGKSFEVDLRYFTSTGLRNISDSLKLPMLNSFSRQYSFPRENSFIMIDSLLDSVLCLRPLISNRPVNERLVESVLQINISIVEFSHLKP